MTSELFQALKQAEASFEADASLANLDALEAAERAYFSALGATRAAWAALPEGERKDSAELNAYDTVEENSADRADELYRLQIAISTYELTA